MNSQVYDKLPKDIQVGDVIVGWSNQIWDIKLEGWEVLRVDTIERGSYDNVFKVRNTKSGTIVDNYSVYDNTRPFQLLVREQPYDPTQAGDTNEDI